MGDKEISFDKGVVLVTVLGPEIGSSVAAEMPAEAVDGRTNLKNERV